jgi:hypothetical protein
MMKIAFDLTADEIRAFGKLFPELAMRILGLVVSHAVAKIPAQWGITIDPAKLTLAIYAGYEYVRARWSLRGIYLPLALVALTAAPSRAAMSVRLDTAPADVSAIMVRDVLDGRWDSGVSKPLVFLDSPRGELIELDAAATADAVRGNPSVGFVTSIPLGKLTDVLYGLLYIGGPALSDRLGSAAPDVLAKIGKAVAVDVGASYDTIPAGGARPWQFLVGVKVGL